MSSDRAVETAADLAATAALLEIAEEIGVSSMLDRAEPFTVAEVAAAADAPERSCAAFLAALVAAGLVDRTHEADRFVPAAGMAERRYESGYLSWALNANRPYIDHAPDFLRNPDIAGAKFSRDGRRVAVASRWVGSQGFYPRAFAEIAGHQPARVVDLGAGAGALVIHLLRTLPDSTGVVLDLSEAACVEAGRAAQRAGVAGRLDVVNRSIESLADDPSPVEGAEVVHAGYVLHDVVGDEAMIDAVLRSCRVSAAPGCRFVITDAVPYAGDTRERAFSALFTYLHASSMDVRLPSEGQWEDMFRRAGFADVTCVPHRMPGGRMFVATG